MTATETNLSTQYDPKQTETKWQQYWADKEVFKADPAAKGEPYCIVIPPTQRYGEFAYGTRF